MKTVRKIPNQYEVVDMKFFDPLAPVINFLEIEGDEALRHHLKLLIKLNLRIENSVFRFLSHKFVIVAQKS